MIWGKMYRKEGIRQVMYAHREKRSGQPVNWFFFIIFLKDKDTALFQLI